MTRAERVEADVQLVLLLAVGAVAACASWSHVLELARSHGQAGWLAWAVAACVETSAVSAGLEVRRRRRAGKPSVLPATVLVAATVLQLAAQVAQAQPTTWGVLLAAVPALTFLTLVKLALSRGGSAAPVVEAVEADLPVILPAVPEPEPARPVAPRPTPLAAEPVDVADLVLVGQAIASDLAHRGESLTRRALVEGLRARGHSVGTEKASTLLRQLRAA